MTGSRPVAARYGEGARSEPVTVAPSVCATTARPLIPAPPIPTKCSLRPVHGDDTAREATGPRLPLGARGHGRCVDRIDRVAREAFGFEALRPGQREAIEAA